jgi:hypothetical protein
MLLGFVSGLKMELPGIWLTAVFLFGKLSDLLI